MEPVHAQIHPGIRTAAPAVSMVGLVAPILVVGLGFAAPNHWILWPSVIMTPAPLLVSRELESEHRRDRL